MPIRSLTQDEFHSVDRAMLGLAFKIHNEYGRLLDEVVYKSLLAERCGAAGMEAAREVPVVVKHGSFSKSYFIDLLLGSSTIVEAKTVRKLTQAHRGQGINHLLLAGTQHGSLVNFRSSKVEREFISTTLGHDDRRTFVVHEVNWPAEAAHQRLRSCLESFCSDIGLGLDIALYREAMTAMLNLAATPIPVLSGSRVVGHQEMLILAPGIGIAITSLSGTPAYRRHLQRFLSHARLDGIAWVNLSLGHIHLEHIQPPISKNQNP